MPEVDETTPPRVLLGMLRSALATAFEWHDYARRLERELRHLHGEPEPEPVELETMLAEHGL